MSEHCGTSRGYRLHCTKKETICERCSTWRRTYRAELAAGRNGEPKMTAVELIEEIERLLNYGEGEHRILTATGYQGRPKSLKERLRLHGRSDLSERIFWNEQVAA